MFQIIRRKTSRSEESRFICFICITKFQDTLFSLAML